MTKLTVDVRELLVFFDEDKDAGIHASSIKTIAGEELGFALLFEYFRLKPGVEATILRDTPTTGKAKGRRLDGWLQTKIGPNTTLYQVEVKSWSCHSLKGRCLSVSATPEEVSDFKRNRWKRYWDGKAFCDPELNKVLTPMRRPTKAEGMIQPLACLWDAVHPNGAVDLFSPFLSLLATTSLRYLCSRCLPSFGA